MMTNTDRIRKILLFIVASDRDQRISMSTVIISGVGVTGLDVWKAWSRQSKRSQEPSMAIETACETTWLCKQCRDSFKMMKGDPA